MRARMSQYAGHASWAVWGRPDPDEDQFIGPERKLQTTLRLPDGAETDGQLHGRVVLLGLNPGNAAARLHAQLGDWYAFHCGSDQIPVGFRYSNDHLVAEACRDTGLWGCYMTDLFPALIDSSSDSVADQVRADPRWAKEAVALLKDELATLQAPEPPLLVCFGAQTFGHARTFLDGYPADRVVGVTHYSASAAGKHGHDARRYRELVHTVLAAHPLASSLL